MKRDWRKFGRTFLGDLLGLNLHIFFRNYFCLQNKLYIYINERPYFKYTNKYQNEHNIA